MIIPTWFIYIIFIAYFIRTIRNVLYMVFMWQLKEYRFDRMLAHLKTPIGRKLLLNPVSITKTVLFLFLALFFLFSMTIVNLPVEFLILFFWMIWVFESILNLKELFIRRWFKPKFTLKAFFIFSGALILSR